MNINQCVLNDCPLNDKGECYGRNSRMNQSINAFGQIIECSAKNLYEDAQKTLLKQEKDEAN